MIISCQLPSLNQSGDFGVPIFHSVPAAKQSKNRKIWALVVCSMRSVLLQALRGALANHVYTGGVVRNVEALVNSEQEEDPVTRITVIPTALSCESDSDDGTWLGCVGKASIATP
jgi:hypothetical protein